MFELNFILIFFDHHLGILCLVFNLMLFLT